MIVIVEGTDFPLKLCQSPLIGEDSEFQFIHFREHKHLSSCSCLIVVGSSVKTKEVIESFFILIEFKEILMQLACVGIIESRDSLGSKYRKRLS